MTFVICNCNHAQEFRGGVLFPDGTTIKKSGDGYDYFLPDGYTMWHIDSNSTVSPFAPSGKIKCDCTKGGGSCAPSYAKGTIGCYSYAENPCLECKSTVTPSDNQKTPAPDGIVFFKSKSSRHSSLMYHSDIYPVDSLEEWLDAPWIDSEALIAIEDDLNEVQKLAYEGSKRSDQLVTVLMQSNRGKFTLDVPMRSIGGGSIYIGTVGFAGEDFSCSGCESKCVLKKKKIVIRYCEC